MIPEQFIERIEALNLDFMKETAVREIVEDAMRFKTKAALEDTPRARLFREAKPALLALGISMSRAGALIIQWLKLTHDDDQLVLATILKAQDLAVMDAPSWILATLQGRCKNGKAQASKVGFSGIAARARRAREAAGEYDDRPAPEDLEPINRR